MHSESVIHIEAPARRIFDCASDLSRWPAILPHYRHVRYLVRGADRHVVRMAAHRSGIPISWVSEQIIDRSGLRIFFHHLEAFTKGMDVVWSFEETAASTKVVIQHDLSFRFPPLAFVANRIIGDFFIENIAGKTLAGFKRHLERRG